MNNKVIVEPLQYQYLLSQQSRPDLTSQYPDYNYRVNESMGDKSSLTVVGVPKPPKNKHRQDLSTSSCRRISPATNGKATVSRQFIPKINVHPHTALNPKIILLTKENDSNQTVARTAQLLDSQKTKCNKTPYRNQSVFSIQQNQTSDAFRSISETPKRPSTSQSSQNQIDMSDPEKYQTVPKNSRGSAMQRSVTIYRKYPTAADGDSKKKITPPSSVENFLEQDILNKEAEVLERLDDQTLTILVKKVLDQINKMYGDYLAEQLEKYLGSDKYTEISRQGITTYDEFLARRNCEVNENGSPSKAFNITGVSANLSGNARSEDSSSAKHTPNVFIKLDPKMGQVSNLTTNYIQYKEPEKVQKSSGPKIVMRGNVLCQNAGNYQIEGCASFSENSLFSGKKKNIALSSSFTNLEHPANVEISKISEFNMEEDTQHTAENVLAEDEKKEADRIITGKIAHFKKIGYSVSDLSDDNFTFDEFVLANGPPEKIFESPEFKSTSKAMKKDRLTYCRPRKLLLQDEESDKNGKQEMTIEKEALSVEGDIKIETTNKLQKPFCKKMDEQFDVNASITSKKLSVSEKTFMDPNQSPKADSLLSNSSENKNAASTSPKVLCGPSISSDQDTSQNVSEGLKIPKEKTPYKKTNKRFDVQSSDQNTSQKVLGGLKIPKEETPSKITNKQFDVQSSEQNTSRNVSEGSKIPKEKTPNKKKKKQFDFSSSMLFKTLPLPEKTVKSPKQFSKTESLQSNLSENVHQKKEILLLPKVSLGLSKYTDQDASKNFTSGLKMIHEKTPCLIINKQFDVNSSTSSKISPVSEALKGPKQFPKTDSLDSNLIENILERKEQCPIKSTNQDTSKNFSRDLTMLNQKTSYEKIGDSSTASKKSAVLEKAVTSPKQSPITDSLLSNSRKNKEIISISPKVLLEPIKSTNQDTNQTFSDTLKIPKEKMSCEKTDKQFDVDSFIVSKKSSLPKEALKSPKQSAETDSLLSNPRENALENEVITFASPKGSVGLSKFTNQDDKDLSGGLKMPHENISPLQVRTTDVAKIEMCEGISDKNGKGNPDESCTVQASPEDKNIEMLANNDVKEEAVNQNDPKPKKYVSFRIEEPKVKSVEGDTRVQELKPTQLYPINEKVKVSHRKYSRKIAEKLKETTSTKEVETKFFHKVSKKTILTSQKPHQNIDSTKKHSYVSKAAQDQEISNIANIIKSEEQVDENQIDFIKKEEECTSELTENNPIEKTKVKTTEKIIKNPKENIFSKHFSRNRIKEEYCVLKPGEQPANRLEIKNAKAHENEKNEVGVQTPEIPKFPSDNSKSIKENHLKEEMDSKEGLKISHLDKELNKELQKPRLIFIEENQSEDSKINKGEESVEGSTKFGNYNYFSPDVETSMKELTQLLQSNQHFPKTTRKTSPESGNISNESFEEFAQSTVKTLLFDDCFLTDTESADTKTSNTNVKGNKFEDSAPKSVQQNLKPCDSKDYVCFESNKNDDMPGFENSVNDLAQLLVDFRNSGPHLSRIINQKGKSELNISKCSTLGDEDNCVLVKVESPVLDVSKFNNGSGHFSGDSKRGLEADDRDDCEIVDVKSEVVDMTKLNRQNSVKQKFDNRKETKSTSCTMPNSTSSVHKKFKNDDQIIFKKSPFSIAGKSIKSDYILPSKPGSVINIEGIPSSITCTKINPHNSTKVAPLLEHLKPSLDSSKVTLFKKSLPFKSNIKFDRIISTQSTSHSDHEDNIEIKELKRPKEPPRNIRQNSKAIQRNNEKNDIFVNGGETIVKAPLSRKHGQKDLSQYRTMKEKLHNRRNILRKKVRTLSKFVNRRIKVVRRTYDQLKMLINLINVNIDDATLDDRTLESKMYNLVTINQLVNKTFLAFENKHVKIIKAAFVKMCVASGGYYNTFIATSVKRKRKVLKKESKIPSSEIIQSGLEEMKKSPVLEERERFDRPHYEEEIFVTKPLRTYTRDKKTPFKTSSDCTIKQEDVSEHKIRNVFDEIKKSSLYGDMESKDSNSSLESIVQHCIIYDNALKSNAVEKHILLTPLKKDILPDYEIAIGKEDPHKKQKRERVDSRGAKRKAEKQKGSKAPKTRRVSPVREPYNLRHETFVLPPPPIKKKTVSKTPCLRRSYSLRIRHSGNSS